MLGGASRSEDAKNTHTPHKLASLVRRPVHVRRRDDDYDAHNDDDPTRTTDDGDKVVHPGDQDDR